MSHPLIHPSELSFITTDSHIQHSASNVDSDAILGQGAFGIVRKAIYHDTLVAVKSLKWIEKHKSKKESKRDPLKSLQLLLAEATKMRELSHPRIVAYIGFIVETSSIVMEYMDKGSLDDYIAHHHNMPWHIRIQLAQDIAEGMMYLHAKTTLDGKKKYEIFHQDLKSGNVLLCLEAGEVRAKITDFGLSVFKSGVNPHDFGSPQESGVRHLGGTRVYMAPELALSTKFTKECDVYAFGVILLELGTLLPPDVAIQDYLIKVARQDMPPEFKKVIKSALHLTASSRPSFQQLLHDLSMIRTTSEHYQPSAQKAIKLSSEPVQTLSYLHTTDLNPDAKRSKVFSTSLRSQPIFERWHRYKRLWIAILFVILVVLVIILIVIMQKGSFREQSKDALLVIQSSSTPPSTPVPTLPPLVPINQTNSPTSWGGVVSYYLYALQESDQQEMVTQLQKAHVKMIRIYITDMDANILGTQNEAVDDLEPIQPGMYNDTILDRIDKLMVKLVDAGIQLIIAPHDRQALGCWTMDSYQRVFQLPSTTDCDAFPNQPISFYTNATIIQLYDQRLTHILTHKNPYLNNTEWRYLNQVIYAFEVQNEPMLYMSQVYPEWICDRAKMMKTLLNHSGIKTSSGASSTVPSQLQDAYFRCADIDLVGIHAGDIDGLSTRNLLTQALNMASKYNKTLYIQSMWCGSKTIMSDVFNITTTEANRLGVPWFLWQAVKSTDKNSCRFYTTETQAWNVLAENALFANNITLNKPH